MADNQRNENEQINEQRPSVQQYLLTNKYDSCLWLIRLYMIFSTACYMLPVFGQEFSKSCFRRVFIGSAAISALRLHQRLPGIQFSMEFARQLVLEDSFHYLIYSVLFLIGGGATMALMPIFVFAVMHAATYTRKVLNVSGSTNFLAQKVGLLLSKIEGRDTQQQMLMFIATSEILVFVASLLLILTGQGSFLVPFLYYRFLQLRYSSRRNPYSRMVFNQLRITIEQLAVHPKCPSIGSKLLRGIVSITLRFAPATTTHTQ